MAMQSGFIKRIRDIMRMDAGINGDAQRIEQMVWMLFLKVYDAKEDDWELNEDDYESIIPEALRWRNWAKADSNGHAMTGDKLLNFVNNILFPVLKGNDVKDGDAVLYEGIKVTPDTPIKKAIVKSAFEDANNYMKDGVYLRQVIDVIDEIAFDDVKESHAFGFVYEEILRELQSAGSSGEAVSVVSGVSAAEVSASAASSSDVFNSSDIVIPPVDFVVLRQKDADRKTCCRVCKI